jgi:hypothetical protein
MLYYTSNHRLLGKAGRKGTIPWGKVQNTTGLVDPKFILETTASKNPTRIQLKDIECYWKDWVSRDEEGEPFCFLSVKEEKELKRKE